MKTVISIVTLTVGLAFTVPAFAQEHCKQQQTQEACKKEGCFWDGKACSAKPPQ